MSEILSVNKLLTRQLNIPNYQRPYKWTRKNVSDLFGDIDTAISDSRRPDYTDFKYRVGSVILHNNNGQYDIVDGQQRLITLSLIKHVLDSQYTNDLLTHIFADSVSIENIFDNNRFIKEWLSMHQNQIENYKNAFDNLLEVVVLEVDKISEAFQLFDSQNTRGKELDPHDLLKAYHLREMNDYPFEKLSLIRQWEDIPPYLIMLDEMAVKKLFAWAMMIRADMDNLGMDTINNYAIGNKDKTYTNRIPMFFNIATARSNLEIANMKIQIIRNPDKAESDTWKELYQSLKMLMGAKNE